MKKLLSLFMVGLLLVGVVSCRPVNASEDFHWISKEHFMWTVEDALIDSGIEYDVSEEDGLILISITENMGIGAYTDGENVTEIVVLVNGESTQEEFDLAVNIYMFTIQEFTNDGNDIVYISQIFNTETGYGLYKTDSYDYELEVSDNWILLSITQTAKDNSLVI